MKQIMKYLVLCLLIIGCTTTDNSTSNSEDSLVEDIQANSEM